MPQDLRFGVDVAEQADGWHWFETDQDGRVTLWDSTAYPSPGAASWNAYKWVISAAAAQGSTIYVRTHL